VSAPPVAIAGPIAEAVAAMGRGPLTDAGVRDHLAPLFSRVLARDEIYLANHSLGRPPDVMAEDVRRAVDLWYTDMDAAWEDWLAAIEGFRARVGALVGAGSPDRIVPKTNAGQGLRAALNALPSTRPNIVATSGEFDSVDVILKAYRDRGKASVRFVEPREGGMFDARDVVEAIGDRTDLVVVSQVFFTTGQVLADLEKIVDRVRAVGARVLVDTYHSAGVMPVDLEGLDADFAIGGSYKYTRGGPGACWMYVGPSVIDDPTTRPVDTGWFAKAEPFAYERADHTRFAEGGDAWLESTPPFLTAYQAKAGLDFTLAVGVERLREQNLAQQRTLANALRARGVTVREIADRGAFLLVPHEDATGLCAALRQRGVNTDARGGCVRFGPDALNTEAELVEAADRCAAAIQALG
jgi:kynureninase